MNYYRFFLSSLFLKVAEDHLFNEHKIEVDDGEKEVPLPRKRGPRRGLGNRGRKLRRDNSQGQDLQEKGVQQDGTLPGKGSNQPGDRAGQDQDLQGEDAQQQQDSLLGTRSNEPEGIAGRGQDLQREDTQQQQEPRLGKESFLQVENVAGQARLPTRKRFY